MSFLSASGNVGYGGLGQSLADTSCGSQYKMIPPSVVTGDVTLYPSDVIVDEQTLIPHVNDYYHSKFKIDPDELYTFHDSDIIANEITVPHTEDFDYNETVDYKREEDDIKQDFDFVRGLSNGDIKQEIKEDLPNGHYKSIKFKNENSNTKVAKTQNHMKKESRRNSANDKHKTSSSKANSKTTMDTKNSINSVNSNHVNNVSSGTAAGGNTFLDVFKREQVRLSEDTKTEPSPKGSSKKSKSSRSRRGRGPALHEALQRIPTHQRVVVESSQGDLPECGPLQDTKYVPFHSSTDRNEDEEILLNFDIWQGSIEECSTEERESRLAVRRAALRRQVSLVAATNRLSSTHRARKCLLSVIKKQFSKGGVGHRLPTYLVNQLLVEQGSSSLFDIREKRKLRQSGWSGGESMGSRVSPCSQESCSSPAIPCAQYCLAHATLVKSQHLYAPCAAVFAGGSRCRQPLLPLHHQTPLCAEHAWKRDNYDKLNRECKPKPKKVSRARPPSTQALTELTVGSNSSAYDSSEDTGIGGLSENEYIAVPSTSLVPEVCSVEQVSADDMLDPGELGQIPDEAFTEFFNQSEGAPAFVESEELTRALEAVLDERALDLDMFSQPRNKMAVPMEVTSVAPS